MYHMETIAFKYLNILFFSPQKYTTFPLKYRRSDTHTSNLIVANMMVQAASPEKRLVSM